MDRLASLGALVGRPLRARDGDIGSLREILFDDRTWAIRHFVLRIGGPMTGARVAIGPEAVAALDRQARQLALRLSRQEVARSRPAGCVLPVSRHYDAEFRWRAELLEAPVIPPHPDAGDAQALPPPPDPHLRSSGAVRGYRIRARDGHIGHVDDFLLSPDDWRIAFLVVATRNWWPGKRVLLPPDRIEGFDWAAETLAVSLARESLRNAPAYRPARDLDRAAALRLSGYYRRAGSARPGP